MYDFNGIGIKTTEDLQEALEIETTAETFVWQFQGMVDRWGLKSATESLAAALCGDEADIRPLLKFKKRYVADNPNDKMSDYHLEDV